MMPPNEGQFFTVAPPTPARSPLPWLLPLGLGTLAVVVLVLSFGMGQSKPLNPSTPTVEKTPNPRITGFSVVPSPPIEQPIAEESTPVLNFPPPQSDTPTLAIAQVHCPGLVANFRSAPALNSQIQRVIQNGELIETTGRQVTQDGVTWQEIRYRNQIGWVAANFLEGR